MVGSSSPSLRQEIICSQSLAPPRARLLCFIPRQNCTRVVTSIPSESFDFYSALAGRTHPLETGVLAVPACTESCSPRRLRAEVWLCADSPARIDVPHDSFDGANRGLVKSPLSHRNRRSKKRRNVCAP